MSAVCLLKASEVDDEEPLTNAIGEMHLQMDLTAVNLLRVRARRFAEATGGKVKLATGCSGSDLVALALKVLFEYWHIIFGVRLEIDHYFSVEHTAWKRDFMNDVVGPQYIFNEMDDLSKEPVRDCVSAADVKLAIPHVFLCGIECDSVSPLSY